MLIWVIENKKISLDEQWNNNCQMVFRQVWPKQSNDICCLYVPCISIISLMDDFYWKPITDSDSWHLGEQETVIKHIKRLSIHFGDRIQSWSLFNQKGWFLWNWWLFGRLNGISFGSCCSIVCSMIFSCFL